MFAHCLYWPWINADYLTNINAHAKLPLALFISNHITLHSLLTNFKRIRKNKFAEMQIEMGLVSYIFICILFLVQSILSLIRRLLNELAWSWIYSGKAVERISNNLHFCFDLNLNSRAFSVFVFKREKNNEWKSLKKARGVRHSGEIE